MASSPRFQRWIRGELAIRCLHSQPGVTARRRPLDQLLDAGRIDALTLAIHPVVAGAGRGSFARDGPKRLSLTAVQRTSTGNLLVTYGPRQD